MREALLEIVEEQLRKLSAGDKMSDKWAAELEVLHDLVDHHVNEEESTGFSCARDEFDKGELDSCERYATRDNSAPR